MFQYLCRSGPAIGFVSRLVELDKILNHIPTDTVYQVHRKPVGKDLAIESEHKESIRI